MILTRLNSVFIADKWANVKCRKVLLSNIVLPHLINPTSNKLSKTQDLILKD